MALLLVLPLESKSQTLAPERLPPPELELPSPLRPEPEIDVPSPSPPPQPDLSLPAEARFWVKEFRFRDNTIFSDEQLQAVVAPFTRRWLTPNELLEARAAVTRYYVERGYVTSAARVPPQDFQPKGAVIAIQVNEGQIEDIIVSGEPRLQGYVHSRLRAAVGPVYNQERLQEALRFLQKDPLIRSLSVQNLTGTQVDQTILAAQVQGNRPYRAEIFLNNARSPAVGSFERGIEFQHLNLLGLGDRLLLRYRNTAGSNIFEGSYRVPVNPRKGTIEFSYSNLGSKIIEEPFNAIDIITSSQTYNLTYRQPLIRRATDDSIQEFSVGATASWIENESSLLGIPFPISLGADEQGQTKLAVLRFFQDWTQQDSQQVIAARSQFSAGLGIPGSTINESSPDGRFFSWRGQAAWLRNLPFNLSLLTLADLQFADRPLVPLEQFSLGGAGSVRGYRRDLLLSNNGVAASVELGIPVLSRSFGQFSLHPFFDVGTAWNGNDPRSLRTPTLASLGLGLQYRFGDTVSARLDWGFPLISLDTGSRTWQDVGFLFSVQVRPF